MVTGFSGKTDDTLHNAQRILVSSKDDRYYIDNKMVDTISILLLFPYWLVLKMTDTISKDDRYYIDTFVIPITKYFSIYDLYR